ncbi:MAG TPA: hypothetical protein VEV42_19830 [Pyrinomonadaceae bacterium]|jgi:hypothetical protein|nr:hypothetical protein [Pyrinomonadaceae bacterium]
MISVNTHSESEVGRAISTRLLFDDTWPLHSGNGRSSFARETNDLIGGFFDVIMTPAEVREMTRVLAQRALRPGDFVLVPFMSAACIYETLVNLALPGVLVLPLPLSRHPFISLMPPCPGGAEVLEGYEALSAEFMNILRLIVDSDVFSRMVFFDSNSATGRDFAMLRRVVEEMSGGRIASEFLLLCNETTADSLEIGPGHRGGKKTACPDQWALRVKGSNVKYLSHLYLLLRFSAEELEDMAAEMIDEHPNLFALWNDERLRKHSVHGYGPLGEGASWKSRLRFAMGEEPLKLNPVDPARLDSLRGSFSLNNDFLDTIFHADPGRHWKEAIDRL